MKNDKGPIPLGCPSLIGKCHSIFLWYSHWSLTVGLVYVQWKHTHAINTILAVALAKCQRATIQNKY